MSNRFKSMDPSIHEFISRFKDSGERSQMAFSKVCVRGTHIDIATLKKELLYPRTQFGSGDQAQEEIFKYIETE